MDLCLHPGVQYGIVPPNALKVCVLRPLFCDASVSWDISVSLGTLACALCLGAQVCARNPLSRGTVLEPMGYLEMRSAPSVEARGAHWWEYKGHTLTVHITDCTGLIMLTADPDQEAAQACGGHGGRLCCWGRSHPAHDL